MAIEDRNLKGGEKLVATYKGKQYTCDVLVEDGKLRFITGAGKAFTSPSAAGSDIRDGKATNGWAFWSLEGQEPAEKKPAASPKPVSITEHREKKAAKKPTARKSAATCPECGETRKSTQGMASHMRAHARAATAAMVQV